jgi:F0F1-type ATP synthase membrane subunit b/b'
MRRRALEERHREEERIQRETESELARIEQHAAQEVESAGKLARLEVRRYAAKLAIGLAEHKLRARMSPDSQAALVRTFMNQLGDGLAKAQSS